MKVYVMCLMLLSTALTAGAQIKAIKRLLANEADTSRRPVFLPLPAFSYAQETGVVYGAGAIYSFYTNRNNLSNRSSNLQASFTLSTKKNYNLGLDADVWNGDNTLHYLAVFRLKKTPYNFYGIGNGTHQADKDNFLQYLTRLSLEAEKLTAPHAYTGALIGYERYKTIDAETGGPFAYIPAGSMRSGGVAYIGLSQSYDSRNTNNYPTRGQYHKASLQYMLPVLGRKNFTGTSALVNLRAYYSVSRSMVLAAQAKYQGIYGGSIPFYLLPRLGNDELMRGYYEGRYRDKNLLAMQAELRYRYNSRLGAVIFAQAGNVWGHSAFTLGSIKPGIGGGLRYFYDPEKGLALRLDYGIGNKPAHEKRQSGFYIALAQAF